MRVKEAYRLLDGKFEATSIGEFQRADAERGRLNIYRHRRCEFIGFGGAFTEASAYNYSCLDEAAS